MEKILKGIDISEFNGDIDFKKVKNEVDYIYIRATFGRFGKDKKFDEYVMKALENEIPVGFYYYSYATDTEKAKEEVNFFLDTIKPYKEKITFPAVIDMEDSDKYKEKNGNPCSEELVKICKVACERIVEEKLIPCIYACEDWFLHKLDSEDLKDFQKWVAYWNVDESKIDKTKYTMWQYSSKGKINGIKTNVDLDYSFVDYIKLKEYVENVQKINFIKSKTLFSDIVFQFMSCYKWGSELINKMYKGLTSGDKLVYKENLTLEEKKEEIRKFFGYEKKTIEFLSVFIYSDDVFTILYNTICGKNFEIKD